MEGDDMIVPETRHCAYGTCLSIAREGSKYCSVACKNRNADDRRRDRNRWSNESRKDRKKRLARRAIWREARGRKGPAQRIDRAEALRLYAEPSATEETVARQLGCSRGLVWQIRLEAGVPKKPRRPSTPEDLAGGRANTVARELRDGHAPFTTRDLERRFAACTAYAAALVMKALSSLNDVVVTWHPDRCGGHVKLVASLRVTT
jgi:transposase-like protein